MREMKVKEVKEVKVKEKDPAINALAQIIRKQLRRKNVNEYVFRVINVGGVMVVPVIYKNPKLVNIESQNIMVKRKYKSKTIDESLSLCHESYTTIEQAILIVKKIHETYKLNIRSGDIQSPSQYTESVLSESVLPYNNDEICSICLECTTDVTECNHGICLPCRDKCIISKNAKCPICRVSLVGYYKTLTNYYSNMDFPIVSEAYLTSLELHN
jgi:hypothetical protein